MSTMTMTVASINPPRPGGKKNKIIGTGGETIYAYPDKAAKFVTGRSYEITYEATEYNGKQINNLESFREVEAPKNAPAAASPPASNGNGPYYRPTAPADSLRMFVCANLTAMIRAGKVENTKEDLWGTTQRLKAIYEHTFGDAGTFQASEAGRAARG